MKYYSEVLEVKTWFLGEEKLEKEKNRKKKIGKNFVLNSSYHYSENVYDSFE